VCQACQGLRAGAGGDDAGTMFADAGQSVQGAGDARGGEPVVELRDAESVNVEQVEDGEVALGVVAQELGLVEVFGKVVGQVDGGRCVRIGLGHAQLFGRACAVSAEEVARDANGRAPVGHGVRGCAHGR